ncbi:MAG TPA: hypothetical protein VMZ28_18225 [Kofleriaceae bacterium]|nr:hypothetical protein [Kofleriaceae bacterium]
MSRPGKKLALRRESLRNLSEAELGQVGGGYYGYNYGAVQNNSMEWVILKQPATSTSRTDSGGYAYFNYNMYY